MKILPTLLPNTTLASSFFLLFSGSCACTSSRVRLFNTRVPLDSSLASLFFLRYTLSLSPLIYFYTFHLLCKQISFRSISQVHTSPKLQSNQQIACITLCQVFQIQFNKTFPKLTSFRLSHLSPKFGLLPKYLSQCISSPCNQLHKAEPWVLSLSSLCYFPYPKMHFSPIDFAFKKYLLLSISSQVQITVVVHWNYFKGHLKLLGPLLHSHPSASKVTLEIYSDSHVNP